MEDAALGVEDGESAFYLRRVAPQVRATSICLDELRDRLARLKALLAERERAPAAPSLYTSRERTA